MEQKKTQVNPGTYNILATDRFENTEDSTPEYKEYRRKWNVNAQEHIVGKFPLHLDIESVSACNLRCIMCPWHGAQFPEYNLKGRGELGYMSMELFKKIIDEAAKYKLPSIKLNYRGEPILHPKLPEMIKYAKDKGVLDVQFNTNGLTLTEELARKLIEAGLDRIIFSVDGGTKETYEKIRVLSNYDRVSANIKRLVQIRNSMGLKKPSVRVQMCKQEENAHEVEQFVENWVDVVNRIGFGIKKDPNLVEENVERFPCPQIWQRMMICFNGEVRPCCGDWNGGMAVGDVTKQTIYEIWHSDALNRIRQMHLEGRYKELPVCWTCDVNTTRRDTKIEAIAAKYNG